MTLQKESVSLLKCLCGLCEHDTWDVKCPYRIMLDKSNPGEYQEQQITKIINSEVKLAIMKERTKKPTPKVSPKTAKTVKTTKITNKTKKVVKKK